MANPKEIFNDDEMVWLRVDISNPLNKPYIQCDEHGNIKVYKKLLPLIYFSPVSDPLKRINIVIKESNDQSKT
jgi:hypothetical protein